MKIEEYNGKPVREGTRLSDLPLEHGDIIYTSFPLLLGKREAAIWDVVQPRKLSGNGFTIIGEGDSNLVRRSNLIDIES